MIPTKRHDIAELHGYSLNRDAILSLQKTNTHWINDLSSPESQLSNELIDILLQFRMAV
ncbi:hypothetical protein [Providencia hangzhouensis]|uniref:hypothetical protein n=1 Tax=Providencia hangzhouensis TaxID=3031799 RepID=UPI0034DD4D19